MATFNNPRVIIMLFALVLMKALDSCNSQMVGYSNVSCIESERKALAEFRGSLVDMTHRLSSWVGADCCKWHGVGCSKITGRVVKLDLRNPVMYDGLNYVNYSRARLVGHINPSLLNLKHLRYLDLSNNDFLRIPKFLGSFNHLIYLNLSASNFGGEVPHHLGNLTTLQYLDLSDKAIIFSSSGESFLRLDPGNLTMASKNLLWLSSLKHLDLSGINLEQSTGWLNAINMLPSLLVLKLAYCELPTIPHLSYVNFTSLVTLDLSGNRINTTMPPWFSNLTSLLHLNLGSNNFINWPLQGCTIGQLTTLTILDLSGTNYLKVSIPTEIGNLTRLTNLDLSNNMFDGYIPIQLGELKNLEYLILSYNLLTGSMPAWLGKLTFLRELVISNNELSGSIPSSIGQLANLEKLDVGSNSLSGTVSEHHFEKLKHLTTLMLSSNSLVFNVSSKWVPPFQLQRIFLGSCTLGPQFPPWLQTQRHVKQLLIFNTSISDTIPDWFENVFSRIPFLDISYNQIGGELPEFQIPGDKSLGALYLNSNKFEGSMTSVPEDVVVLDLSNNFLSGNLPLIDESLTSLRALILSNNSLSGGASMLCKIKNLVFIDLSTNQFSGGLPLCLGELQNLIMLDLKNNSFSGHIPSSLSSLQNLRFLHLHSNKFQGKFPLFSQNLTNLITLDLGENALTDTIPEWIVERLPNLKFLSLQSNSFHGEIPLQLCHHPALQLLNLAHNNITGRIPQCFGNFSSMAMLPESKDFIKFSVRLWILISLTRREYGERLLDSLKGRELEYREKAIPFLVSMDLSENNIIGEIPDEITDLVGLRNFNVAGNMLKGRIPKMIGNLKQLESLDLSRNKISGAIPASLSDLNYLSHLNLSFNCLSGKIPTGNQLQTLDDPSIYMGNKELCGKPLPNDCPGDNKSSSSHEREGEGKGDEDASDRLWFYAGVGPGFLVGFLGVCGILHFNKSCRYAFFQLIENMYNWIVVAIAVKLALLRRKLHAAQLGRSS